MRNQSNFTRNESRGRQFNGNSNAEGVESRGRGGKLFNQMSEGLPDFGGTLSYMGKNWRTIARAFTMLGVLGAVSKYRGKSIKSMISNRGRSSSSSRRGGRS